jgi:hypothetical protein
MAKNGFRMNTKGMSARLETFNPKAQKALSAAFAYQEPKSTARMKTTARWTDRTGNARSSLFAKASQTGNTHKLLLSHGMSYGIFLEVRFSGRYSIVRPEILLAGQDLMRLTEKLLHAMPK